MKTKHITEIIFIFSFLQPLDRQYKVIIRRQPNNFAGYWETTHYPTKTSWDRLVKVVQPHD